MTVTEYRKAITEALGDTFHDITITVTYQVTVGDVVQFATNDNLEVEKFIARHPAAIVNTTFHITTMPHKVTQP